MQELIDFENIFVEPPDLQSCDIVWFCSNLTFQATKNRVYYSQRFWFCILAAVWGIAFAVTSYLETFCCRPITEMIRLIAKIPGPRKCVLIYTRCFKQVCFGCFIDEDEDEKMETKSVWIKEGKILILKINKILCNISISAKIDTLKVK